MKFAPGEVLLRRFWRGGRISLLSLTRVAADDERGLRLWVSQGWPYWRIVGADGRSHHDAPLDQLDRPTLTKLTWTGWDVMMWMPQDEPWSVWWMWADGTFDGWYVNLEDPYARWADRGCAGVDTADHALDVVVAPDRTWRWKDEDELDARTGHPLYWTPAQAGHIRAAGQRVVHLIEGGRFPFDGTWRGYRPDASWTAPGLPSGYDRPRAVPAG
jgi:Protein of unknown function (DUF402)